MKCSRRPAQSLIARSLGTPPGPRRRSAAPRRARASARDGGRHLAPAARGSPSSAPTARRRPRGVSSASAITTAAPACRHPGGVGVWWSAGRVRVGDEDRRPPGRGDLEDRAAGAGQRRGRRRRGTSPRFGLVLEQRVALGVRRPRRGALAQLGVVAAARRGGGRGSRARRRLGEGLERGEVDRARALAAADDQQAARRRRRSRTARRAGAAVGLEHRGRAPAAR